jgi:Uma2 family endonuclease
MITNPCDNESAMSTTALLSFAEFEQLPDAPGKRELIDGELIEMPPPKLSHSIVARRIYELLREALDKSQVWMETGYRIGGGWLQPDVSVTRPDHPQQNDYLIGAPIVAVELLSPRNTAVEIERKLSLLLGEGGEEVWVIDPKRRSLTVYRRSAEGAIRILIDSRYTSVTGITIDRNEIFPA